MSQTALIELPVVCTLSAVRMLTPFHWALLEALAVFPVGSRPAIGRLAERLRLGERAFLDEAWRELVSFRAVDADAFSSARRSVVGDQGLERGWFAVGASEIERRPIFFRRDDGALVRVGEAEIVGGPIVVRPPPWSRRLSEAMLVEAVALGPEPSEPTPARRVVTAEPDWKSAREVRLRPRHPTNPGCL